MDKLLVALITAAVIFILSYKPESRTMERFISQRPISQLEKQPECCGSDAYRANHHTQCEAPYFQNLQFGQAKDAMACPIRQPNVMMGAITDPANPADYGV